MKFLYPFFFSFFSFFYSTAQTIAFVGFDVDNDQFAFVLLTDVAVGIEINFSDDEWDETLGAFNSSEGIITWTNTEAGTISAGTVITITSAINNPQASLGSAVESDLGFNLTEDNEALYAYTGTDISPTFLAALFIEDPSTGSAPSPDPGNLPSSLVLGTTALNVHGDKDSGVYDEINGTACNGTLTECLQMINNVTNCNLPPDGTSTDAESATLFALRPTSFSGSALPVELINFSVDNKTSFILLEWSTVSEINNDRFEIERSQDGSSFEYIGEVEGMGQSSVVVDYTYEDRQPHSGMNFYRLKQVDFDDQFEYTFIVSVRNDANELASITIRNDGSDLLRVRANDPIEIFSYTIYSFDGRQIGQNTFTETNQGDVDIDISYLTDANYVLRLQTSHGNKAVRFNRLIY